MLNRPSVTDQFPYRRRLWQKEKEKGVGVAGHMTQQQAGSRMRLRKALPDLKKKITTLYFSTRAMLGYGLCAHDCCSKGIKQKNLSLKIQDEYLEKQGLKTKGYCKATKNDSLKSTEGLTK